MMGQQVSQIERRYAFTNKHDGYGERDFNLAEYWGDEEIDGQCPVGTYILRRETL